MPANDPGPHDRPSGGWTLESLGSHLTMLILEHETRNRQRFEDSDRRYEERFKSNENAVATAFSAQEKAVNAALAAAERAVGKAEVATEKRLEGMNEFRKTLSDQAATLMPRTEAEAKFGALVERLYKIEQIISATGGQKTQSQDSGQKLMWAGSLGVTALLAVAAIVASMVKH